MPSQSAILARQRAAFSAPGLVVLTAKVMVFIACMIKDNFAERRFSIRMTF